MPRHLPFALIAAALALAPAAAQKRSPADAAKDFTLDPIAPSSTPAPAPASNTPADQPPASTAASETPSSAASDPAADAPIVTTLGPPPSLDTPIAQLVANSRTKAVLDKDLPGLSTDQNFARFGQLSLRRFQPLTGGQLTTALLNKVGADLAALSDGAITTLAPPPATAKSRRGSKDEGR